MVERRFAALCAEIYAKCLAYLADLISQMVARLCVIDPDELDTPPPRQAGLSRPRAADIVATLSAHPLSAEAQETAWRAALAIAPHGVIGEHMWTALDLAAHHYQVVSRTLGLIDLTETT